MRFPFFVLASTVLLMALVSEAEAMPWSGPFLQENDPDTPPQAETTQVEGTDEAAAAGGVGGAEAASRTRPAHYRSFEECEQLLARWTANGLAERIELGRSAGDLPLWGVVIATPGPIPARERKTILVVGGLDGRSLAGSEGAARVVEDVLAATDRLASDVAVVVVPWANPDALSRTWSGFSSDRNARAIDDDGDGFVDEDGPDDLDGDGAILSMLIEDPEGGLARSTDGRFLRVATPRDLERWRLVPEGRDDDGDGLFNEDGPGGIRLDADFPMGWSPGPGVAFAPFSQPETRALAALSQGRRIVVALFLQGNHGRVAYPGGSAFTYSRLAPFLEHDEAAWSDLARCLATDPVLEPVDLWAASGRQRPGHPVDWLFGTAGVLAAEWSLWGPGFGGQAVPASELIEAVSVSDHRALTPEERQRKSWASPHGPVLEDPAWMSWLDDTRGGLGFVDWVPVEPVGGRRALVGGWEPRTTVNPPEDLLPMVLSGVGERVLTLAEGLPRLVLELESRERNGDVVELKLRVRNNGRLPSGVGPIGADDVGLRIELNLPAGAQLLAGELSCELGHLRPGAVSEAVAWLIQGKEHALLDVTLQTRWGGRVLEEVRL